MKPETTLPARYLNLLMRLLEQRNIDCAAALAPLGMARSQLSHPVAKVPRQPAIEVFQQLMAEHGGTALGLQLGRLVTLGELGDLGLAMLRCATLGEALRCAQEFYSFVTPSFSLSVEHLPDAVQLTWLPIHAMPYDFVLGCYDVALGTMDGLMQQLLGDAAPKADAYLTRARPTHTDYKLLKHIRCHFGAAGVPSLRMCLQPHVWDHPMPLHNVDELAVLRDRMTRRTRPIAADGVAAWVEMMLRETTGEQPTQAFLAQVVGMSSSTLARRLGEEGTTFRALANRVRHEQACELLHAGELSVTDIGARLGYADTPSFVRAFKALSGTTPGRLRIATTKTPP